MTDAPDVRRQIENALAILQAGGNAVEPHVAARNLALAARTLGAARDAIAELDAELELVTSPDLAAAREAQRLAGELEAAQARIAALERELEKVRRDYEIENQLHHEDENRLSELEKKAKEFDQILMKDDAAFGRFMDRALDRDEAQRRKRRE